MVFQIPSFSHIGNFTLIVIIVLLDFSSFIAVMVYFVDEELAIGVPEIEPVFVLNINPSGSEGSIAK